MKSEILSNGITFVYKEKDNSISNKYYIINNIMKNKFGIGIEVIDNLKKVSVYTESQDINIQDYLSTPPKNKIYFRPYKGYFIEE